MTTYYLIVMILTAILTLIYLFMWHKHFDALITILFIIVPIVSFGYYLYSLSTSLETSILMVKFTYIGGCYVLLIVMLLVFSLCNININKWIRIGFVALSTIIFGFALTIGYSDIFYKDLKFERINDNVILTKEYGVMHVFFYIMVISYFVLSIAATIYSYFKKKQTSRKNIYLLLLLEFIGVVAFFGGRILKLKVELTPLAFAIDLVIVLVIVHRIGIYDITDSAIDSIIEKGETGFISFDFKKRYVGSNETAKTILEGLNKLTVDKIIDIDDEEMINLNKWMDEFKVSQLNNEHYFEKNDKCYLVTTNYLFDGIHKRGYQFLITDDTKNQEYIKLLNRFNNDLQTEVEQKTRHIVDVHDKFILGMATMVESRDNSTGGHIKRTSEGVRILIDEMRKDNLFDSEFCNNIIKAAPMHDIGKIAVDDSILRKPGKFTPEEYEIMKTHAAEGARIIHEIVDGTYNAEFKRIAENVAHYHHERVDGSGYPNGLKGDEIPIESRIMAIADVYDALVSKRVYKEKFSFEKAYEIIMEGMGTQFDKNLEKYFISAREKLEKYYSSLE